MLPSLFLIFCLSCVSIASAVHDSMNFILPPKKRECFFEDFDNNSPPKRIEAFVKSGGDLDILLTIHGPLSLEEIRGGNFEKLILEHIIDAHQESDSETQTFMTEFHPEEAGSYGICLDNRKANFFSKTVQLDIRPLPKVAPLVLHSSGKDSSESEALKKAKQSFERLHQGLTKVLVQQQRDRHRLSLYSETNVMSHDRMVTGSIVETAFFIGAALFQVFFVRRWFAQRNNPNQKQRV